MSELEKILANKNPKKSFKAHIEDILWYNRNACEVWAYIKLYQSNPFKEGDFLIAKEKKWDHKTQSRGWKTEEFSRNNASPRKYKVVHIDEIGMPYLKKVLHDAKLGTDTWPLCGIDPREKKYELDPDQVDHTILGDEEKYNPQAEYREVKDE